MHNLQHQLIVLTLACWYFSSNLMASPPVSVSNTLFEKIQNASLTTYNTTAINQERMPCILMCEKDPTCMSLVHDQATKTCSVSMLSVLDNPDIVLPDMVGKSVFFRIPDCLENWTYFKNRCYLFVELHLNWTASQANCESLGGHLAVPLSIQHVSLFVAMTTCILGTDTCFPWIGMSDLGTEGLIVSPGGSPIPQEVLSETMDNDPFADCGYIDPKTSNSTYMYMCPEIATSICERVH